MKNKPADTLTLDNRYSIVSPTFQSQARARTMTRDATTINHDDDARLQPSPALGHVSVNERSTDQIPPTQPSMAPSPWESAVSVAVNNDNPCGLASAANDSLVGGSPWCRLAKSCRLASLGSVCSLVPCLTAILLNQN